MILTGHLKYAILGSALLAYAEGSNDTKKRGLRKRDGANRELGYTQGKTPSPTLDVSLKNMKSMIYELLAIETIEEHLLTHK